MCDNIETVYSLVTKVFTIDEHAFSEIVFNNANLYVPKGKLATYQGTNYCRLFAPAEVFEDFCFGHDSIDGDTRNSGYLQLQFGSIELLSDSLTVRCR